MERPPTPASRHLGTPRPPTAPASLTCYCDRRIQPPQQPHRPALCTSFAVAPCHPPPQPPPPLGSRAATFPRAPSLPRDHHQTPHPRAFGPLAIQSTDPSVRRSPTSPGSGGHGGMMCGVRSSSAPALRMTGRPPLPAPWLAYAANTDAASIWGTSTAASSVAMSQRSSSDRVDLEIQSTSHRGVPHFLLSMQSTAKAKGLAFPGASGQLASKIGGVLVISAVSDEGSEAATAPTVPCSPVGRPVQLGCHGRPPKPPPQPRHWMAPPRHPFTVM
ncbi:hypothetical protein ACQJBY_059363 [Aegilops geniculata]